MAGGNLIGTLNTFSASSTAVSADVNENFADIKAAHNAADVAAAYFTDVIIPAAEFAIAGVQSVATFAIPVPAHVALVITDVIASVGTAPTGADLIVDILRQPAAGGGFSSIFTSGYCSIAAGEYYAESGAPNTSTCDKGDQFKADVTQVGSTIAGSDLHIKVIGYLVA